MAFTYAPSGLVPVGTVASADYNSALTKFFIEDGYAVDIGTNDPVGQNGGGIKIAVAGAASVGSFQGVKYLGTDGMAKEQPNWVGGTNVRAMPETHGIALAVASVISDPNVVYSIQCDSAAGLTFPDLMNNANFVIGAPDASGRSTTALDLSTSASTATLNLKIADLDNKPGNNFGTAYNYALVTMNNHWRRAGVVGV